MTEAQDFEATELAATTSAVTAASAVRVEIIRLDKDLPVPEYAHPGDAGADLRVAVDVRLDPGQRMLVPTGVAVSIPPGFAGFVHPRSGLSVRLGLGMVNAPGTIDSGFRGEIKVNLINLDPTEPIYLRRGDRIAQLIIQRIWQAEFVEADCLPESVRGKRGFGSTG